MTVLAGKIAINACGGARESSSLRMVALAFVLFALTLRAALPLGLSIVTDDNGIPMVICSQVAQIQARLDGETDPGQRPNVPGYQCPFCMVLSADNAAIPVLDGPAPSYDPVIIAHSHKPLHIWAKSGEPRKDDNLGRDPPLV